MRQKNDVRTTRVWSAAELARLREAYPRISRDELVELVIAHRAGSMEAAERIVFSNIGLVLRVAIGYERFGVPKEDLVSGGLTISLEKCKEFNPALMTTWSTFIVPWLRHVMCRMICNGRTDRAMRMPVHENERRGFVAKTSAKYYAVHGREPRNDELLTEMRSAVERRVRKRFVKKYGREPNTQEFAEKLATNHCYRLTVAQIDEIRCFNVRPVSFDAPISGESGDSIVDYTADPASPETRIELAGQAADIERIVKSVLAAVSRRDERSRVVLRRRFGLDGGDVQSLEEIGATMDLTRERVRQLEFRAIRQIATALRKTPEAMETILQAIGEWTPATKDRDQMRRTYSEKELRRMFAMLCEHVIDPLETGVHVVRCPVRTICARTRLESGSAKYVIALMIERGWVASVDRADAVTIIRTETAIVPETSCRVPREDPCAGDMRAPHAVRRRNRPRNCTL